MLIKLEMKSILSKFKDETVSEASKVEVENIDTIEDMKKLFSKKKDRIYIDYTLTDASTYSKLELEYLIIGKENMGSCIKFKDISSKNKEEAIEILKILMENENIKKVIHDGKNFVTFLNKYKIEIRGFDFDTAIAAYLIDSSKSKYEILDLVNNYIGVNPSEEGNNLKVILSSYLPVIYEKLKERLHKENMDKLYYEVEHPLIYVLSSMESIGFNINERMLDELKIKFKKEIEETQAAIYKLSEEEFNISSPKQLGKILFEKLDLPVFKKTKTGYSTNQEVLEKLMDKHDIIPKIMYYRQITKINSTYIIKYRTESSKYSY
jgi:DNA polymerase-1